MKRLKTAILGGSGLYQLDVLQNRRREVGRTPYGDPSAPMVSGEINGNEVVFLPRHGLAHSIPPHRVNYRANIWALKNMGVEQVIGVAAVGGISTDLKVGDIVLPDQLLDYTYGRAHTFFDGESNTVEHIDFSFPYQQDLRMALIESGHTLQPANNGAMVLPEIVDGGVYAATQGPRLETAAEINKLERDGGTIVGMTGMPEAALAREAELAYACLALVVNPAAGRSDEEISIKEIGENLQEGMKNVVSLLQAYFN